MSAYIIVSYDIIDPEAYSGYVPAVVPLLQKHGAEILVADYEARPLEGQGRGVYVVLRFESEQAAMAWYDDPDYAEPKGLRIRSSANTDMVLARGFVPPSG